MLRIALKGMFARKVRLLLTSLAVMIGTAFLAGTAVFSDTLKQTFDELFADVFANVDTYVRSSNAIEQDFGEALRDKISSGLVAQIEEVPGVADAQPFVQQFARIIGPDGKPLGNAGNGPPTFGGTVNSGELSFWKFEEGRPPSGPTEVGIDRGTAETGKLKLGDTVKISAVAGVSDFTVVGIASYGDIRSPGGATFALFDETTSSEFVNGRPDAYDAILVRGDGSVDDDALAVGVKAALAGTTTETLTGEQITKETQTQIREALSFFSVFLQIFAFIALFVATFVIYNLFSITVAQRRRENALFRAVGATRRQVTVALFVEAVAVGLVGSVIGLLAGLGLSRGLRALLGVFGLDIPSRGLALRPATIVSTIVIGLVVTVVSAVLPALRSGKVPPVAAMRDDAIEQTGFSHWRMIIGLIVVSVGVAGILGALFGGNAKLLGLGAPALFIGLFIVGPLLARPMARVLGRPIGRISGVPGRLAAQNAARNPKRTARAAAALVVGAALVTGVTVMASSVKSSIRDIFGRQFVGEMTVTSDSFGFGGLPVTLADDMNRLPEIGTASGIGVQTGVRIGDTEKGTTVSVVDPATVGAVFDLGFVKGSLADLGKEQIAVSETKATDEGWDIGSPIELTLIDGVPRRLTVAAIYAEDDLAGRFTVNQSLFEGTSASVFYFGVFATTAPGVSEAKAKTALLDLIKTAAPDGKVLTRSEYIDEQAKSVDPLLGLMIGLLLLSVVIAAIGIIITLLLSVYERRRELGLIRAVGMSRRQVWTSVTWEAVIVTLVGVIEGMLVGLFLGFAIVKSLESEGLKVFSIPWPWVIAIMVIAIVIGVLAALVPAWKSSRLNILDAIATT